MPKSKSLLTFGRGNAKLGPNVVTFSLPAGHSCPGAKLCLTFADRRTGKITDGPHQAFRCFAASDEARYPTVRRSRWHNFELLRKARTRETMASLILRSLPPKLAGKTVRIHVSGDFFNKDYFLAWTDVARANSDVTFYAYTKSIDLVRRYQEFIPDNLVLTASLGGRYDTYVPRNLKSAQVVFYTEEAAIEGLEIDHDDSHAMDPKGGSFALLIHGSQPKNSAASRATAALRANGFTGYSRKK